MKISSGKNKYRKFTARDTLEVSALAASNTGNKTVTKIIITIIMLKAIIRYLNFNWNTPAIAYCWNNKIKRMLRQRCVAAYLNRSIFIEGEK